MSTDLDSAITSLCLNGTWSLAIEGEAGEVDCTVPGNICQALVESKRRKDPRKDSASGLHENLTAVLTRTVEVTQDLLQAHFVELSLQSVQGSAQVLVNGKQAGQISSYFERPVYDVTGLLNPGSNELAIHFSPQGKALKSGFTLPSDFGPGFPDPAVGDVSLCAYTGLILRETKLVKEKGSLALHISYEGLVDTQAVLHVSLAQGSRQTQLNPASLQIQAGREGQATLILEGWEDLEPWRPLKPSLVDVNLRVEDQGKDIFTTTCKLGYRDLAVQKDQLQLNQETVSVYAGVLLADLHLWALPALGQRTVPPAHLKSLVNQMFEAGLNTVVLPEQGGFASEDLLALCDQKGLMVVQTLPVGVSEGGKKVPLQAGVVETEVQRLSCHPSVVLLAGWAQGPETGTGLPFVAGGLEDLGVTSIKALPASSFNETLDRVIDRDDRFTQSEAMEAHVFGPDHMPEILGKLAGQYKVSQKLLEFSLQTQMNQAQELYQSTVAARFQGVGSFCFPALNEMAPGVSPTLIDDSWGPKAGYYALKRALAPEVAMVEPGKDGFVLKVHSLDPVAKTLTVHWRWSTLSGKTLEKGETPLETGGAGLAGLLNLPGCAPQDEPVGLFVDLMEGTKLKTQAAWLDKPVKHLKLPTRPPHWQVRNHQGMFFQVTLDSMVYLHGVRLRIPIPGVHLSDNFFDLYPGLTKTVTLTMDADLSPTGIGRVLEIDFLS